MLRTLGFTTTSMLGVGIYAYLYDETVEVGLALPLCAIVTEWNLPKRWRKRRPCKR